jgi:hypothetical protein
MPLPDDMPRIAPRFPAVVKRALLIACVLLAAVSLDARPRYGGTLRVQVAGAMGGLDPSTPPVAGADAQVLRRLRPLVFETLVRISPEGGFEPALAVSWSTDPRGAQWRLVLRDGVRLHDGSPLDASRVADALRANVPDWKIAGDRNALVIEPSNNPADVLWRLADARQAIVVRVPTGERLGTGPFRVERIDGSRALLRAHEDYWGGRAFLDAVQIDSGRSQAAQLQEFELDRADMVSVQPGDRRRVAQRSARVIASRPLELYALVFEQHRAVAADEAVRRTFAASIDRVAIRRVLMQELADPAESLLPAWISGYDPATLLRRGRQLDRAAVSALTPERRTLVLRVDPTDTPGRALADRIAVNARDAGLLVTVQAPTGLAARPDLRLVRLRVDATAPERALDTVMTAIGARVLTYVAGGPVATPPPGAPLQEVQRIERLLLERDVIVPIVHAQDVFAFAGRVDWVGGPPILPSGGWDLARIWLKGDVR